MVTLIILIKKFVIRNFYNNKRKSKNKPKNILYAIIKNL